MSRRISFDDIDFIPVTRIIITIIIIIIIIIIRKTCENITKTCLFKYTENFTSQNWKFSDKKTVYVLSKNKKNNVYPCKPQFFYIKGGFKGVKII